MAILNEIQNEAYFNVLYANSGINHSLRLYPRENLDFVLATGDFIAPQTTPLSATPYTNVITYLRDLLRATQVLSASSEITSLELWQSATGEDTFLGFLPAPAGTTLGIGSPAVIWSSYVMWTFGTNTRQTFRFTVFDTAFSNPSKASFSASSTPVGLTGSQFAAEMLRSFNNNDGVALTRTGKRSVGVNKALSRRYGQSRNGFTPG